MDRRNDAQSPTPGAGGAQAAGTPAGGGAETSPHTAATSPTTNAPANETSVDTAAKKEEHKQCGNFTIGKCLIQTHTHALLLELSF